MHLNLAAGDSHHIETEGMAGSKVAPRDHSERAGIETMSCPGHLREAMAVTKCDIREPVSDLLNGEIDSCSPGLEEYIAIRDPMRNQHITGCRIDILWNWP